MIAYIVEFLGTLLLASVIISTGRPVYIALALFLATFVGGSISGGHFNPAVSFMYWLRGSLTRSDFLGYIIAQLFGGVGALVAYRMFLKTGLNSLNLLS